MASKYWEYSLQQIRRGPLLARVVRFYQASTDEPLTVFTTDALTTPHVWPLDDRVISAEGYMPAVFIGALAYRFRAEDESGNVVWDVDNIPGYVPPVTPEEQDVTEDEIFQTGDFKVMAAGQSGWILAAGGSIGSATSGASARANSDTHDLYVHNWDNYTDEQCPVAGGRGAGAPADWDANKPMGLPDASNFGPWYQKL